MLDNMLEKVWWYKRFKIESWNWTICCLMSCSKGGKHVCAKGGKKLHVALKCCYKTKVLLLTHVKASKNKGHWSTINLTLMMETTRAQLHK